MLLLGLEIILNDLGMNLLIRLDHTVECVWGKCGLLPATPFVLLWQAFVNIAKGPEVS